MEADWAAVARVACWRGPWGANVFLLDVSFALEKKRTLYQRHFGRA